MRAGDGVYAVDLHETDPLDQALQGLAAGGTGGYFRQRMTIQEDAAGAGVRDQIRHLQGVSSPRFWSILGLAVAGGAIIFALRAQDLSIGLSPDKSIGTGCGPRSPRRTGKDK